jgi:hypothetical protein
MTEIKIIDAAAIIDIIGKLSEYKPTMSEMTACRRALRNQRVLAGELKEFNEARNKLVTEYTLKDDKGEPVPGDAPNTVKLQTDKVVEFNEKLHALTHDTIKVELQDIDAEKLPACMFTCAELVVLEPMLKG